MATEGLDWDVVFFRNTTANSASADTNAFVDLIPLRASAPNGQQIGGSGLYLYGVSDFHIQYVGDGNVLVVGLVCRSAAGKTAGAGGEVALEVDVELPE